MLPGSGRCQIKCGITLSLIFSNTHDFSVKPMLIDTVYILGGFGCLAYSADILVIGASFLARRWSVSPLVIGLTIVAFGTSAPEIAVSIAASFAGQGGLSIGNVVGSNISNIGLALGLSAIARPLVVQIRLIRFEIPLLIGMSFLVYFFAWTGEIGRWHGIFLFLSLVVYIRLLYQWSLGERPEVESEYHQENTQAQGLALNIGRVLAGLAGLVLGGHFLVEGAVGLARLLGLSELVIGLTIVAVGTSLPEIVTSIVAVRKGQGDIAIGNVLGSNLFNLLGALGAASAVHPIAAQQDLIERDFPVMLVLTLILLPFLRTGQALKRWEGGVLVLVYIVYIGVIFFRGS